MSSISKQQQEPHPYIFNALICCYNAFDFQDCIVGCKGKNELCCLTHDLVLAAGHSPTKCGIGFGTENNDNNECLKFGIGCCACGLKVPNSCFKNAQQACCIKNVGALPFDKDYLPGPHCALYCLSLGPKFGCCMKAPPCKVLERCGMEEKVRPVAAAELMQRGGDYNPANLNPLSPSYRDIT